MWNPGSEQTVTTADGRTWTLGRLTVKVLRDFGRHVRERIGDPFERVERFMGKAPEEETKRQLREAEDVAEQLRFFSLSCPIAQMTLATEDGWAHLIWLLLLERQPAATIEDGLVAAQVLLSQGRAAKALELAQGEFVGNETAPG